ncbi:MAG: pentapeptide repeat-containing protein [Chloroflexota bacterium]
MAEIRNQQAKIIRQDYADFYRISSGLTLVVLGIWIGSLLFNDGYGTNVYTEALGVLATILVLNQFNQRRDKHTLKQLLLMQVRSPEHYAATTALEWLRTENWLERDTFKHTRLERINWNNMYIGDLSFESTHIRQCSFGGTQTYSNFERAKIYDTTLDDADLSLSNFRDATIWNCTFVASRIIEGDFSNAELQRCQFWGADLIKANLAGAIFYDCIIAGTTSLEGANLMGCSLEKSLMENLRLSSETILPDGTSWTPDTDLAKFTDRNHPDFASTREAINTIRAEIDLPPLD